MAESMPGLALSSGVADEQPVGHHHAKLLAWWHAIGLPPLELWQIMYIGTS